MEISYKFVMRGLIPYKLNSPHQLYYIAFEVQPSSYIWWKIVTALWIDLVSPISYWFGPHKLDALG